MRIVLALIALLTGFGFAARADIDVEQMPAELRAAFVRGIQEELNERGYVAGKADGAIGPRTRAAIQDYQRDAGIEPTGKASKDLLDHLRFAQPRISAPKPAQSHPPAVLVRAIQEELVKRGYYHGAADGAPGPATQTAIRAFQRDAGLPISGMIDERLLSELRLATPAIRAAAR